MCFAAPKGLARALHLPLFAWGLTLDRRRRSGARGLYQGPPFHNRLRFAWVAGEGAGVRQGRGVEAVASTSMAENVTVTVSCWMLIKTSYS